MDNKIYEAEFNEEYKTFFVKLTGHQPYEYQTKVAYHLSQGRNIILQAPTGSGKTLAVLVPFLFSLFRNPKIQFADRLLYALPLRSLVDSLSSEISKHLENSSLQLTPEINVQTSSRREDEYWLGDIIFMTLDQLLAGYLTIPSGLSSRLDNLLAGALLGSLVILDEFHLFDPARSMKTTFELIERMKSLTQFVIMSATFSDSFIDGISTQIEATKIIFTEEQVNQLPSHKGKERKVILRSTPLSTDFIISKHQNRSLVIVNTVDRAQRFYREVKKEKKHTTKVILLHSRFLTSDRELIEQLIHDYFTKHSQKQDVILITTQVIEAGMDISADILHTELSPANSLIQRIGRCARYPPPRHAGTVYIHQLPETKIGKPNYYPYISQVDQIDETYEWLATNSGGFFPYSQERNLINHVHTSEEKNYLFNLKNISVFREEVEKVLETHHDGYRNELIRNIISTSVLVSDRFESIKFIKEPLDTVSISTSSLANKLSKSQKDSTVEYLGAYPSFIEDIEEEYQIPNLVEWHTTRDPKELLSRNFCILNPQIASYNAEEGLIFETNDPPFFKTTQFSTIFGGRYGKFDYECESFLTHAQNVFRIFKTKIEKNQVGLTRLSHFLKIPTLTLSWYFEFTALFHDLGKLQKGWQIPIQEWQQQIDPNNEVFKKSIALAHSTSKKGKNKGPKRRSPHAAEGGMLALILLAGNFNFIPKIGSSLEDLFSVVFTSIAHHHIPRITTIHEFEVEEKMKEVIEEVLEFFRTQDKTTISLRSISSGIFMSSEARVRNELFSKYILRFNDPQRRYMVPAYFFLVRNLRLSDFESFT